MRASEHNQFFVFGLTILLIVYPEYLCQADNVGMPVKGGPNIPKLNFFSNFMPKDTRASEKHKHKFKEDTKRALEDSIVIESKSLSSLRGSRVSSRAELAETSERYSSGENVDEEQTNSDYSSSAFIEDVAGSVASDERPRTESEVIDRFVDILDAQTLQPIAWPSLKRSEKGRSRESHRSRAFSRRSMLLQSDSSDRNHTNYLYMSMPQYERRVEPLRITIENDRNPLATFLFGPRSVCVPSPVLLKFELYLNSQFGRAKRKNPFEDIPFEHWKETVSELHWFGYDKRIFQRENRRKLQTDTVKSFQTHWMTRLFTGALHKYIALVQRTIVMGNYNCDVIKYQWFHRGSCIFVESDLNGKQLINTMELTKGLVPEFAFDDENQVFPEIRRRELNNFLHLYKSIALWESHHGDADLVLALRAKNLVFSHELDYIWGPNYWLDAYLPRDIYAQSLALAEMEVKENTLTSRNHDGIFSSKEIFSPILVNVDDESENTINEPSFLWCPSHDNASILSSAESFRTDYSEKSPFSAEEVDHFRKTMEQTMLLEENSSEKSQPLKFGIYNDKCFTVTSFSREAVNDHIVGTPSPRHKQHQFGLRNNTLSEDTRFHYVMYPATGRVEDTNGFFTVRYFPPTRVTMYYGQHESPKGFTPQEGDAVKCLNAVNMIRRVARNPVLSKILENPHFVRDGVCLVGINEKNTFYG